MVRFLRESIGKRRDAVEGIDFGADVLAFADRSDNLQPDPHADRIVGFAVAVGEDIVGVDDRASVVRDAEDDF